MTAPRFDALASRLLERAGSDRIDGPLPEDRARAIALIEGAIRRKNRRRLSARVAVAVAAAALLGAGLGRLVLQHEPSPPTALSMPPKSSSAVTVVGHPTGGGATIVETGVSGPLKDGKSLAAGSRIVAQPDGHVVLSVSTGTRLTVEENGDLAIVESGNNEIFSLRSGAVRADVAKLHAGQRFVVRTPDAEVEVRGTAFRVAMADPDPACEGGAATRVSVYEGVVTVRHAGREERISAGQRWPEGCDAKEASVVRPARSHSVSGHPAEPASSAPSSPEQTASDLREQNDFFGQAFAAKRRGAAREAIEGFEAFVARYPSSSLVESALAQRMQLLRSVDRVRAASAARQYLSRYPRGFARDQAEAIEQNAP